MAVVTDDIRGDLDQRLAQAGQRPRLRRHGHRQHPHEIAEIVGQRVELTTDALAAKERQDSRAHLIALLPSLIHCSAVPRWS
jgi:hypothetical protein